MIDVNFGHSRLTQRHIDHAAARSPAIAGRVTA
jgi:hypothetical protein